VRLARLTRVTGQTLSADIVRPSALGPQERALWQDIQAQSAALQRAFLTPTFAEACERANGRAYVAILHEGGAVQGFFPFQFRSMWHQRLRLAERIGGEMSDAAGLVAVPGFRVAPASLLRLAGLSALTMTHLVFGQEQFGLQADESRVGHVTEISDEPEAYFAALLQRDRILVRDTERRIRKAASSHGALRFARTERIPGGMIAELIAQKRLQYGRTDVTDVFARGANIRLIEVMNEMPAPECQLVMSRLEAGGTVLAQHLGPQHHGVLSHWFPVYDPAVRNLSPGRLLLWHMIQDAVEAGIRLIDFGEGDALYKREFATATVNYGRANWSIGDLRSMVARAYQGVEWRLHARRRGLASEEAARS
jgi:CelD/BcsL family acetyltransferase involved in cellulose biosynthesis